MITLVNIVFSLLIVVGPPAEAVADSQDVFLAIQRAFNDGDATALGTLMADYSDIRLPDNNGLYSRAQTGYVLRAFFRSYPPERFVIQRRFSGPNGWFLSGHYWHTRSSTALSVSIQLEERGNRTVIRSMLIEGGS